MNEMLSESKPVFVVSTGRAGSTMIARVLAKHPALFAIHEPIPHLNAEALAKWSQSHNLDRLQKRVRAKRAKLIEDVGKNDLLYVESAHYWSHLIPELREEHGARFVHLYRDGRAFVRSALERPTWYGGAVLPPYFQERGFSSFVARLKNYLRRWTLLDVGWSHIDHRLHPPRDLESRVEKLAWLWSEINGIILESLRALPAEMKTSLRLEDFGKERLSTLLDFVGVQASTEVLNEMAAAARRKPNKTKERSVPSFEHWDERDQAAFCRVAGGMMKRLGYEETPELTRRVPQARTL